MLTCPSQFAPPTTRRSVYGEEEDEASTWSSLSCAILTHTYKHAHTPLTIHPTYDSPFRLWRGGQHLVELELGDLDRLLGLLDIHLFIGAERGIRMSG